MDASIADRVVLTIPLSLAVVLLATLVIGPVSAMAGEIMVPGTIQAEDYDLGGEGVAYHDTTPGNQGGAYRTDDVDVATIPDGHAVVGIAEGEYLIYTVNVTEAGAYTVTPRVASPNSGRRINLSIDGRFETTLSVPNTGSLDTYGFGSSPILCWDIFDSPSGWYGSCDPLPVSLSAGTHTLKFTFQGDGLNFDWFDLTRYVRVTPGPTRTPPTPTPPVGPAPYRTLAIPGTIQAEDYNLGGEGVAYHDTTPGNAGGVYRHDDVDIEQTAGIATPNVGWIRDGEYLTYTANIATAGAYTMTARVASPNTGRSGALSIDGSSAVTFTVPNTRSYAAFRTVSVDVTLPAGTHTLKLIFHGDGQNLDWIAFVPSSPTPTPPPGEPTLPLPPGTIPGMIEAEDFNVGGEGVAYHDTTAGNSGGAYRQEDVDIETGNGITNVGWIRPSEWLKYVADVRLTGDYDVVFRVSSPRSNTQIRMLVDGIAATIFTVPNTGSYDTYTNVTQKVRLSGGPHVLRFIFSGYHNIDWIAFGRSLASTTTVTPTPSPDAGRASFTAAPLMAARGSAVKFSVTPASGKSIGATWWSFDATAHLNTWNSRATNPTFFYPAAGTFSPLVKITYTDGSTETVERTGYVRAT